MSGGSWDYAYCKISEVSDRLRCEKDPLRRALGEKMRQYSEALHDIEWNDSGDGADESKSIKIALGKEYKELTLAEIKKDAAPISAQLKEIMEAK